MPVVSTPAALASREKPSTIKQPPTGGTALFTPGPMGPCVVPGEEIDPDTGYGILIRYNTFTKDLTWNPWHPSYAGAHVDSKNLLEFKTGSNALIDQNFFQYSWGGDQDGAQQDIKGHMNERREPT